MKLLREMIIVIVLLLVPAYVLPSDPGYMRISFIEGDVEVKTPDVGDWGFASVNRPLFEGDEVWVPQDSSVELQLNADSYIRLDQNSSLQILSMDWDSSQFYLSQGHAYIYYDAPRGSVIQVDTPDASTRAFDRAVFRVDMSDRYRYTDVAVYMGYVEAENEEGRTRVNADEMLSLGRDTDGEVAPMGPPDEWERWNKERNDRIRDREGASSDYLPSELRGYSYDFDTYGRWYHVPAYGYCWTPTYFIEAGWSPYRHGRWIWANGDYIWVGHEPWGWAPYHYGRWAYIVNTGWCWVPPLAGDVFWAPGYVGWVWTDSYVGWVPLAPGEIYYGRGHHGRHSVNITNININRINVTNVYKNVYINNGVTVVERKTFAGTSPKMVNFRKREIEDDIFTSKNFRAGAPAIRPVKGSYFASGKTVPAAKLPPRHVRDIQIKQLKQSRPHIKEPDRPVMGPGARIRDLPVKTVRTPRTPGRERPMLQSVRPVEREKTEVPERGPAPGEKRTPQVRPSGKERTVPEKQPAPEEKRASQVRPSGKKRAVPEKQPAPGEKRAPQVRPSGKERAVPEKQPAPGEKRAPQVGPSGKERAVPERGPAPKEENIPESEESKQKDWMDKRGGEPSQ